MADNRFHSEIIATHSNNQARAVRVTTPHGDFITPVFMPVATKAFVHTMTPQDLQQSGSQIILGGNTYHMLCHPGMEVLQHLGGMHTFMDWSLPMLTDSGGFQVFSLSKNSQIAKINEDGAVFKHPNTGAIIHLNPHTSMSAQKIIGADIIMAFDQCTEDQVGRTQVLKAMERTHRWLLACCEYQAKQPNSVYGKRQALFGIIQGADYQDLRCQSAEFVTQQPVDGIAIGGETIGFDMAKTREIVQFLQPYLPKNKLRYTMGVGSNPQDLIDVVTNGIDMFDCVSPTRIARHGGLYCGEFHIENNWPRYVSTHPKGRIQITNARYRLHDEKIMPDCSCHTCQHYSRGYLHYLCKMNSVLYYNLACIHNVSVMHETCTIMRNCILQQKTI